MKTFLSVFIFISSIICQVLLILILLNKETTEHIKVLSFMLADALILTWIIKDFIKDSLEYYNNLNNKVQQSLNSNNETLVKTKDIYLLFKEHTDTFRKLIKVVQYIDKQGTVNQDSLGQVRDNIRNILKIDSELITIIKEFASDNSTSHISTLKIIETSYNTINNNQLELLTSINKLPNNISKDDIAKLTTRLDIILDNQKYLVDQLIISKPKRVSETNKDMQDIIVRKLDKVVESKRFSKTKLDSSK